MKQSYYIPIKSVNLGHYFSKACICPSKFLKERNDDIQNIYDDHILLSTEKYTEDSNCSIEIVLTEQEVKKYIIRLSDYFFLLKIFIPISRVSNIYFKEKEQGEKTIWNIEQGKAFVPIHLVSFEQNGIIVDVKSITTSKKPVNNFDKENELYLDKFNRLLGGFALMRLGGESFMNYSLN